MRPAPADRRLDDARRALGRSAWVARVGLAGAGLVAAWSRIAPFFDDAQLTWGERRVALIVAGVTVGGFTLAGWVVGRLLGTAAGLVGALADLAASAARTADLVETRVIPALDRLGPGGPASSAPPDAIRRAIAEGRWSRADRLLADLRRDDPEGSEGDALALALALASARHAEAERLQRKLDAALAADDADLVLTTRDALTRHVQGAALRDLDVRLARWLIGHVRGRARQGDVSPALAELAASGSDRFGDGPDGRALLGLVPDLRRRAGLCPACARPHRGPGDTCPACSGSPSPSPARPKSKGTS